MTFRSIIPDTNAGFRFAVVAAILVIPIFQGCVVGPEEAAIKKMITTLFSAIQQDDDILASACLLDLEALMILNPEISTRRDPEDYTETVIASVVHEYRLLRDFYAGHELKVTYFQLGTPWYQYKGYPAFRDTNITLSVDGKKVDLVIRGIVKVGDRWIIVDLSGNELL